MGVNGNGGSGWSAGGKGVDPRAKESRGEQTQRDRLREELVEAIEEIDEEGLLFLLQQARVLIHNAHVERLQKEADLLPADRVATRSGKDAPGPTVEITEDGESFFIDFGSVRKVMSRTELRGLVRICRDSASAGEAAARLHRRLERERGDILADAGIHGPTSPILEALYNEVRAKYRPRE